MEGQLRPVGRAILVRMVRKKKHDSSEVLVGGVERNGRVVYLNDLSRHELSSSRFGLNGVCLERETEEGEDLAKPAQCVLGFYATAARRGGPKLGRSKVPNHGDLGTESLSRRTLVPIVGST